MKNILIISALALTGSLSASPESNALILSGKTETYKDIRTEWAKCSEWLMKTADNNQRTRDNFDSFVASVQLAYQQGEISREEVLSIIEAVDFSAEKHRFQKRKDPKQTPYISHPIGVADQLMRIGNVRDPHVVIAALLHDTVEDTDASFEEIRAKFGEKVEGYVREVTDDKSLPKAERKRLQIFNASHKSPGAAKIKLSDKLYNLRDLAQYLPEGWDRARQDAYFEWAQEVVDHLPNVSTPLKEAVDETISKYWAAHH